MAQAMWLPPGNDEEVEELKRCTLNGIGIERSSSATSTC